MQSSWTMPASTSDFVYDPRRYRYDIDYSRGDERVVRIEPRATAQARVAEFTRRNAGGGGGGGGGGGSRVMSAEKPVPRLTPTEQRQIMQSAVARGFSTPSRMPPKISSKIMADMERQMQEQQDLRIRDQILSELLSLYLSPRRTSSPQDVENLKRQQEILQGLYSA